MVMSFRYSGGVDGGGGDESGEGESSFSIPSFVHCCSGGILDLFAFFMVAIIHHSLVIRVSSYHAVGLKLELELDFEGGNVGYRRG